MTSTAPAVGIASGGSPAPGTSRGRRRRRRGADALRRAVSPLALLALWQAASATGVLPEDKLAPPLQIFDAMAEEWHKGTLQAATGISLQRVAIGFASAPRSPWCSRPSPACRGSATTSSTHRCRCCAPFRTSACFPLLVLWLGIDEEPKVALIALGVAFPLYVNTVAGIRGVDPKFIDAARALRLSWWGRIRHVVVPGALPSALVGLRLSLGVAWLSLIVAEQINASSGIGYLVSDAASFGRTDVVVGGLLVYSLLGLATDALVRSIERKALAWRHG